MVKTNKKSLIAMIAMVVLLIASIAMGITGAWFTDKEVGTDQSFTFGKIDIAWKEGAAWKLDDAAVSTTNTVMPGCKITYTGTVKNSGNAAYVAVIVTATLPDGKNWTDVGLASNPSSKKLYEMAAGTTTATEQAVSVTIELPDTLSDQTKLNDVELKISVSVYAIQQEHYTFTATEEAAKCDEIAAKCA